MAITRAQAQNLTLEELKELKYRRYHEAHQDGSIAACYLVARELGKRFYEGSGGYGPKYEWEANGVRIYVDDYGHYMTAHYSGQLVCSTHGDRLFIPGEWMGTVRDHMSEASARISEREKAAEDRRREAAMRELGL